MNWEMVGGIAAVLMVTGMWVGSLVNDQSKLRAHEVQLSEHAEAHKIHFAREAETTAINARTVALLDQVEKRVSRIEDHEDSSH